MNKILLICLFLFPLPILAANEEKPTTKLEVLWNGDFTAGRKISGTVIIRDIASGNALSDNDLRYNNKRKIHLLIVDPTLTDLQHIHPDSSTTPYAFNFSFTPKFSSGYKIWTDIIPSSTDKHEFLNGWIGDKERSFIERRVSYKTIMDGYSFVLSFNNPPVNGQISIANVNITDPENKPTKWPNDAVNKPYISAEYINVVGFYEDNEHIFSAQQIIEQGSLFEQFAGPNVRFKIEPKQPGFVKMFMQITLNGKEMLVPFGFVVE